MAQAALFQAMWLAWMVYWLAAARHARPVARTESPTARLAHLLPMGLAAGLLALPVPGGWPSTRFVDWSAGWYWTGAALTAAGIGLSCWARRHLGRNWSGTVTLKRGADDSDEAADAERKRCERPWRRSPGRSSSTS